MSSDIDIEEHDLLEHPTLRGVFPDLSIVKQEVEFDGDVSKQEEQKMPPSNPDDEKISDTLILGLPVEKPDSTSDFVLEILPTPTESPLVTSSQRTAPNPNTLDPTDSKYEAETSFEAKCFQSYVSVQDWGLFLDNSKCYCGVCEILFSTENAFADHNMAYHLYLEEVSISSTSEYQIQTEQSKKYTFGSTQENSVYQCGDCPAKFTRFYNLKKHKIVIHGETLGETTHPPLLTPKVANVQTVTDNLSPIVAHQQTTVPDTLKSEHLCQLCNTSLPTQKDLIAHLYNHITSKNTCGVCHTTFPQKIQLEKHLCAHSHSRHSSPSTSNQGDISDFTSTVSLVGEPTKSPDANSLEKSAVNTSQVNDNKHEKYIKCGICAMCHISVLRHKRHMLSAHQKHATSTLDHRVVTQLYCEQCDKAFQNIKQHNVHMRKCHILTYCPCSKKQLNGGAVMGLHKKKCPLVQPTRLNSEMKAIYSKNVLILGSNNPKIVKKIESKPLKLVPAKPMLTNSRLKVQSIYKCNLCQQSFPRYHLARNHRDRHHADAPRLSRVISRDTQKLILKKAPALAKTKRASVTIQNSKKHAKVINQKTKKTMMLNVVLHCPTCNIGFLTWMGAKSHRFRGCGPSKSNHAYEACDICHISFPINKLLEHKWIHKYKKKLRITTLTDFNQNAYRTLHKCVDCEFYSSSNKIMLEHFVGGSVEHKNCEVCGYRIAGINMKHHLDEHKKYNLTKGDFIIVEYCHTDRLQSQNAQGRDEDGLEPESQGTQIPAENSAKNLQLMRCETCKHHMNPSFVAKVHKDKKCHFVKYQICEQCGLSFTTTGYANHLLQHRQSTAALTFRDFVITNFNGEKVSVRLSDIMRRLFRCKCGAVARSGTDIGHHRKDYYVKNSPCSPERSIRCNICKLTFAEKSYTWHLKFHKADTVARLKSARSQRPRSVATERTANNIVFLRCDKCHLHIRDTSKSIYRHKASDCTKVNSIVCVQCGLTLPVKTLMTLKCHAAMYHKSSGSFTMADFKILRLSDRKPVGREPCRFPRCATCELRVEGPGHAHMRVKRCDEDNSPRTTCRACGKTFADTVYRLHLPYAGCDRAEDQPTPSRKRNATEMNQSAEIEKLMTNYNKIDQAWSQLYQCVECRVLVDSYDEVLTHCESHQVEGYEPTLIMCHVCDLNFDRSSFQRHKEQHYTRPGIERSRFEVLEFKPTAYKTSVWEYYRYAITGSRVSYILKQEGPEQHTIYQCARCKLFCGSKVTAYRHTTRPQYCNTPSTACKECGLTVHSESVPEHEKYHALNPDLTSSSFRIFWFTNETAEDTKTTTKKKKSTLKVPPHCNPLLYKCSVCNIHFVSKRRVSNHLARTVHMRTPQQADCHKCGFLFNLQSLPKHKALHHGRTDYRQKDFTIMSVHLSKEKVPIYRIEKSICNQISAPEHAVTSTQKTQSATATANKNKLILGGTAKKHSMVPAVPQGFFLPKTAKKINPTLYKCAQCALHFMTYGTAQPHVRYDHIRERTSSKAKVCPTCNLAFRGKSYYRHVVEHHRKANYKADDFDIYVISSDGPVHVIARKGSTAKPALGDTDTARAIKQYTRKIGTNEEKVQKKTLLFRCSSCSAHFTTEKSFDRHAQLQSHLKSDVVACNICHYGFKGRTLTSHRYFHHGLRNLRKDDFKIIEKSPNKNYIEPTETYVFKCSACDVCFLHERTIRKHRRPHIQRMAADLKQCKICMLHFPNKSLLKHTRCHHPNGANGTFKVVEVEPSQLSILNDTSEDTVRVPELGQSRENVTNDFTNIINSPKKQSIKRKRESVVFKCSACAVCFLHECTIRNHGFPHIKKEATDLSQCKICQLHFTRISLRKHMRYHHPKGTEGTFKIVEVKPGEMSILNHTSENTGRVSELEQSLENATNYFTNIVYSPEKQSIKRKTESVVFKCSACAECFLEEYTVRNHGLPHIKKEATDLSQCKICQLHFTKISLRKHMRYHHLKDEEGTFKIVEVKPGELSILNDTLEDTVRVSELEQSRENAANDFKNIVNSTKKQSIQRKRESVVFKCSACAVCFLHEKTVRNHGSPHIKKEATDLSQCKICQLHFTRKSLIKHMRYNHPKGAEGTFKIVEVEPVELSTLNDTSEDTDRVSELEQSHENVTNDFTNIVKSPKKQCIKQKKRESVVFKCSACAVCFLHECTVRNHGSPHIKKEATDLSQCKICQLHFTRISLRKHMKYHHPQGAEGTFKIVEVKPGERRSNVIPDDTMEHSDQAAELEQAYENIEYLEEDASSEVSQEEATRRAAATQESGGEASSSALPVPDAYVCPKCSTVFPTSIQLSLHRTLGDSDECSVQLNVRALDTV